MSVSSGNRIIVCKKLNKTSNSRTVKLCKGNWTGVHSSLVVSLHKINKACLVTRVNSTNVLDEGLRIGEIGRRMNSKVKLVEIGVYRK
jgi:hypothetical protein